MMLQGMDVSKSFNKLQVSIPGSNVQQSQNRESFSVRSSRDLIEEAYGSQDAYTATKVQSPNPSDSNTAELSGVRTRHTAERISSCDHGSWRTWERYDEMGFVPKAK